VSHTLPFERLGDALRLIQEQPRATRKVLLSFVGSR
jgi:hypothetical protein